MAISNRESRRSTLARHVVSGDLIDLDGRTHRISGSSDHDHHAGTVTLYGISGNEQWTLQLDEHVRLF